MPPASPFATGDDVVHLDKGLGRITAIKHSAGSLHLVVAIGKTTLWVPLSAWREHLAALPTRAEAGKWLAFATSGAPAPAGPAAATRRRNTIDHRDFAAQLTALSEAYRSGDRAQKSLAALEDLEDHLLPILARSLGRTIDALRAELRAAMPEAPQPVPTAPLPPLGDAFEPIGRARLATKTHAGDPGDREVELATLSGEWLAYRWVAHAADEFGRLVAIHSAHLARASELLAARAPAGTANCEGATALVYDPAIVDDPAALDEIYNPVEPGIVAGRGFALSLGGDGPYDIWTAPHGGRVVLIVAGDALSPIEDRLLRGEDRERIAIEELAAWRFDERRDYDPVPRAALAILGESPVSAAKIAALVQFVARQDVELEAEVDGDRDLVVKAIEHLATSSPDPRPWFERLVGEFERPAYAVAYAIVRVLAATRRRDFGDLVLARLATEVEPWRGSRLPLLAALLRAEHPGAVAALRDDLSTDESAWGRAKTAALLLEHEPGSCELARILVDHLETYGEQDRSKDPANAGYGNDWDELCAAMAKHVAHCEAHRVDWVTQLFRAKRTDDPALRRLVYIAPEELAALTGARTDDELWAWLAAHRN